MKFKYHFNTMLRRIRNGVHTEKRNGRKRLIYLLKSKSLIISSDFIRYINTSCVPVPLHDSDNNYCPVFM